MTCQGFPAATYDLYVLGLLDQNQRAVLDQHVRERCPVCVQGVQRSMRLWLVFASTLQDTEPPANFQARLTEITRLSRNVLTFPKDIRIGDEHRIPRWALAGLAAVLVTIAVIGGWHAGWASANLDGQRLGNQVANLNQEVTTLQLELNSETNRRKHVTAALNSSENASAARQAARLATELLQTQAEINQYKSLLDRQQNSRDDTAELIEALSLIWRKDHDIERYRGRRGLCTAGSALKTDLHSFEPCEITTRQRISAMGDSQGVFRRNERGHLYAE